MSKKQSLVSKVADRLPKNVDQSKAVQLAFKQAVVNGGDSQTRNKQ